MSKGDTMNKFTIDSRDVHKELGSKSKHADWIHRFINRLDLQHGVDYIQVKDGTKKVYKFTEEVLTKLEDKPKEIPAEKVLVLPVAPKGFELIHGNIWMRSEHLASLAEKRHDNVLRDIRSDIDKLTHQLDVSSDPGYVEKSYISKVLSGVKVITVKDNGRKRTSYLLDMRAALAFASRYSVELRALLADSFVTYQEELKAYTNKALGYRNDLKLRHVYIIENEHTGRFKIGVAKNPEKRLKTFQTANSDDLSIIYTTEACANSFDIEAKAHEAFSKHSIKGEWFDEKLPLGALLGWIEDYNKELQ